MVRNLFIWLDKHTTLTPLRMLVDGRFECRYNSGGTTHPMDFYTASDYADIFGGSVFHRKTGKKVK